MRRFQIGAGKTIPTIRTMSEAIMRKRENTVLVRINWDDSDVPRDISDRRYPQNAIPFSSPTHRRLLSFLNSTDYSVCIGRTGALQVLQLESAVWFALCCHPDTF